MDRSQLSYFADIIGIISGIMALLGMGGILSWSVFKKGKTPFSDMVLSIFAYSIKTALCLLLILPVAGFAYLPMMILVATLTGRTTSEEFAVFSPSTSFCIVTVVLGMILIPIYLVLCACIYQWSDKPWEDLLSKLRREREQEKEGN